MFFVILVIIGKHTLAANAPLSIEYKSIDISFSIFPKHRFFPSKCLWYKDLRFERFYLEK